MNPSSSSSTMNDSIIMDCGTGVSKGGISGEDAPLCCFPTIIGRPKVSTITVGMKQQQTYVGHQAYEKSNILHLSSPVKSGVVTNWGDYMEILRQMYYSEMRITPEEHPCLLTETPLNPVANRHRITEEIFETFDVPFFYLINESVLSLFASGRTTGLVLNCGEGVSTSVPVYEGYAVPHAIQRNQHLCGMEIDKWVISTLDGGKKESSSSKLVAKLNYYYDRPILREIKEKSTCLGAQEGGPVIVALPDGQQIDIAASKCDLGPGEILFGKHRGSKGQSQPSAEGESEKGQQSQGTEQLSESKEGKHSPASLQSLISSTLHLCDKDIRGDLFENIVTSGGLSNLHGFGDRLRYELSSMALQNSLEIGNSREMGVEEPKHREFLSWLGGSILTNLGSFHQGMWISKAEYLENGPSIVNKKCF